METKVNNAEACFNKGFNCCQAVLSTFGVDLGMDEEKAMKIASGFGAGIAYMGDICGAVSGAFMVLGLKFGRSKVEDEKAKEKTYKLIHEFVEEFRSKNGSIKCNDLLGVDVGTKEGLKKASDEGKFSTICPALVRDSAGIVERLLKK
ncbi:MAG: C_GCAxxG_C_C family protein [Bacteroidales bacterium]|nr:MAG: C_GCAxxG_C_C family protein [Bacteroidales bacterium]